MGYNSPTTGEASGAAVEIFFSPLIATKWPMTPANLTQQKEVCQY